MHFADEVLDHLLGNFKIGNHAITHRPDGFHIYWRLAQHGFGLITDCIDDLASALRHVGDNRRLIELDALSFHIDQCVRCSEINGHVCGQQAEKTSNHVYAAF